MAGPLQSHADSAPFLPPHHHPRSHTATAQARGARLCARRAAAGGWTRRGGADAEVSGVPEAVLGPCTRAPRSGCGCGAGAAAVGLSGGGARLGAVVGIVPPGGLPASPRKLLQPRPSRSDFPGGGAGTRVRPPPEAPGLGGTGAEPGPGASGRRGCSRGWWLVSAPFAAVGSVLYLPRTFILPGVA